MLCQRCRTGILSRFPLHYRTSVSLPSSRYVNRIPAATHIRLYSTPLTPSAPVPNGHPLSTSDISFASTTSATSGPDSPSLTKPPGAERIASTAPVGTRLSGLSYVKNKRDPVAMDDSEYPDWLWGLLDSKSAGKVDGGGDTSGVYNVQFSFERTSVRNLSAASCFTGSLICIFEIVLRILHASKKNKKTKKERPRGGIKIDLPN